MLLGIREGGQNAVLEQYIFRPHQIPRVAGSVPALLYDAYVLVVYLRLEHFIGYRVHDTERIRFARHDTVGHTDIYIRHRADIYRISAGRDGRRGCELVFGFAVTDILHRDRQGEIRGLLYHIDDTQLRSAHGSTGIRAYEILGVVTICEFEVETEAVVEILLVADVIPGTGSQRSERTASGRVTENIKQRDTRSGSIDCQNILGFLFRSQYIGAQRFGIDVITFALDREIQRMEGVVTRLQEGHMVDSGIDERRTVGIQRHGEDFGRLAQTVIDLQVAACQIDDIRYARAFIIIIVVLMRGDLELIVAYREYRCAEEVAVLTEGVFGYQLDTYLIAVERLGLPVFYTIVIQRHTILHLGIGDRDRTMIGDAVGLVVIHLFAVHRIGSVMQRCFGQIERLRGLAVRIEGSIAAGCSLGDLVFNREEVHKILTRVYIGMDDDTFLEVLRTGHTHRVCTIRCAHVVTELYRYAVAGQVVVVVYDLGDIVALEFEHQFEVVTDVVPAHAEAERLLSLNTATGKTADEAYLGLIIETHAIQRFTQRQEAVLFPGLLINHAHISVAGEGVSLFVCLYDEGRIERYAELEVTRCIGQVGGVAAFDRHAVQYELHVARGYRTVFIEHASAETYRGYIGEIDILANTVLQTEGDGSRLRRGVVVLELRGHAGRLDRIGVSFSVDEAVKQVIAVLVGLYHLHRLARTGTTGCHRDTRTSRAILIADITGHFAVWAARTDRGGFRLLHIAVALVGHRYAVFPFARNEGVGCTVFVPTAVILLLQYRPSRVLAGRAGLNLISAYIAIRRLPTQQNIVGVLHLGCPKGIEVRRIDEVDNRVFLFCRNNRTSGRIGLIRTIHSYAGGIDIGFILIMYARRAYNIGIMNIDSVILISVSIRIEFHSIEGAYDAISGYIYFYRIV